jgi:hypothetical protein|tara:strand:- start:1177 stop:1305 length:129 start_codon:yes stop_codon:yes gene_type:complete
MDNIEKHYQQFDYPCPIDVAAAAIEKGWIIERPIEENEDEEQ